eukprot:3128870-Amphidinium_carterae.1
MAPSGTRIFSTSPGPSRKLQLSPGPFHTTPPPRRARGLLRAKSAAKCGAELAFAGWHFDPHWPMRTIHLESCCTPIYWCQTWPQGQAHLNSLSSNMILRNDEL